MARMERHHARSRVRPGFNVIALMDVFTVLVFFLLVNSADAVNPLQDDAISLPESTAEEAPRAAVVVTITRDTILLQGDEISGTAQALAGSTRRIAPLAIALEELQDLLATTTDEPASEAMTGELTIMADKATPFVLLKRVMATCSGAGFEQITLSVIQKSAERT